VQFPSTFYDESGVQTYIDEENNLTITYNADIFKRGKDLSNNSSSAYQDIILLSTTESRGANDYPESIFLNTQELSSFPWKNKDLENFKEQVYMINNKDFVFEKTQFLDNNAYGVEYLDQHTNGKVYEYFTVINKKAYVFTYTADLDDYEKYLPEVKKIAESMRFIEE